MTAVNARDSSVSFAKCAPLTNEWTAHLPLGHEKETVHRNVEGRLKGKRESALFVKEQAHFIGIPDKRVDNYF